MKHQPLSKQQTTNTTMIVVFLILLGVSARFLPHAANFAPIGALAIFGGLYLPKRLAYLLPVSAMFVSDLFIGFYSLPMMLSVYASFVLIVGIAQLVKKQKHVGTILGGTLLGSVLFFLITNAAVWAFGTMYPHSIMGLMESYTMALPFFKNTLLSDLFYTAVLVGTLEAMRAVHRYRIAKTLGQIS